MKCSVSLYTIAILAGPIHSAFGQSDFPDFVGGFQTLINDVDNAIANFNAIKLNGDLETPTLVKDYQIIQGDAQNLVNAAQDQGTLTTAEQETLHNVLSQLATKVVNLLDETGDDAGDFEINPDQTNIQTAANDAEAVIVELYDTAEKLAPEYADDIALEKTDVEEADADMNNKDANSPLRPRKVSRVFKA